MMAALAFAAGFTACGSGRDAPLPVDAVQFDPCRPIAVVAPDATNAQRAALEVAVEGWNAHGLTRLSLQEPAEGADRIDVSFEAGAGVFLGYYAPESGAVLLNRSIEDMGELSAVAAHELGHAMGLSHVGTERQSVMNTGNRSVLPTAADSDSLQSRCR